MRWEDIGREDLEAREAFLDRLGDLLEGLKRQGAAQSHVKGVVHV